MQAKKKKQTKNKPIRMAKDPRMEWKLGKINLTLSQIYAITTTKGREANLSNVRNSFSTRTVRLNIIGTIYCM